MPFSFQTGISPAAHATSETEQLISHMRTAMVDMFTSLQGSDREGSPVSELHNILNKINDNLDKAVPE